MHVTEIIRVAAQAWNKIKPADDPDFNNCALSHRERCIAQVEALERGGSATNDFEKAAKEILDSLLKAPEPAISEQAAPLTEVETTAQASEAPDAADSAPVITQDEAPAAPKSTRGARGSKSSK